MNALIALTVANMKSYIRDRAALFWTMAFPVVFVVLFGLIFSGGAGTLTLGWVDEDRTSAAATLAESVKKLGNAELEESALDAALDQLKTGGRDAVVVVPQGFEAAVEGAAGGTPPRAPLAVDIYADQGQQVIVGRVMALVGAVLGQVNLGGRPPAVIAAVSDFRTENLNAISYLVPSILGMALMQLGVFAAIPIVSDREKLILKRLDATPLRRWQLVGANIFQRLVVGIVQTALILGVGVGAFGVQVTGNVLAIAGFVLLGALSFLALGYLIAAFAPTSDSASAITSVVQFPLMFLSGTFFQIQFMPEALQVVARFMPLTYLSDALRQVMVGGAAFVPLPIDAAVLGGWLVICFGVAARFFRWQ